MSDNILLAYEYRYHQDFYLKLYDIQQNADNNSQTFDVTTIKNIVSKIMGVPSRL